MSTYSVPSRAGHHGPDASEHAGSALASMSDDELARYKDLLLELRELLGGAGTQDSPGHGVAMNELIRSMPSRPHDSGAATPGTATADVGSMTAASGWWATKRTRYPITPVTSPTPSSILRRIAPSRLFDSSPTSRSLPGSSWPPGGRLCRDRRSCRPARSPALFAR